MTANTGATKLPPPSHIGVVVKDIDKTVEYYTSMWGLGPWKKFECSPAKEQMLIGEPYRMKIAAAQWGPVVLELIQPVGRGTIWSDFLETNGEGLQHLCFDVSNWDEVMAQLKKQGAKMIAGARLTEVAWCYFETSPGGLVIEIKQGGAF